MPPRKRFSLKKKVKIEAVDPLHKYDTFRLGDFNWDLLFPFKNHVLFEIEEYEFDGFTTLTWEQLKQAIAPEGNFNFEVGAGSVVQTVDYRGCGAWFLYPAKSSLQALPPLGEYGYCLPLEFSYADTSHASFSEERAFDPLRMDKNDVFYETVWEDIEKIRNSKEFKDALVSNQPFTTNDSEIIPQNFPQSYIAIDQPEITKELCWVEKGAILTNKKGFINFVQNWNDNCQRLTKINQLLVFQHLGRPLDLPREICNEIAFWLSPDPVPFDSSKEFLESLEDDENENN